MEVSGFNTSGKWFWGFCFVLLLTMNYVIMRVEEEWEVFGGQSKGGS